MCIFICSTYCINRYNNTLAAQKVKTHGSHMLVCNIGPNLSSGNPCVFDILCCEGEGCICRLCEWLGILFSAGVILFAVTEASINEIILCTSSFTQTVNVNIGSEVKN